MGCRGHLYALLFAVSTVELCICWHQQDSLLNGQINRMRKPRKVEIPGVSFPLSGQPLGGTKEA